MYEYARVDTAAERIRGAPPHPLARWRTDLDVGRCDVVRCDSGMSRGSAEERTVLQQRAFVCRIGPAGCSADEAGQGGGAAEEVDVGVENRAGWGLELGCIGDLPHLTPESLRGIPLDDGRDLAEAFFPGSIGLLGHEQEAVVGDVVTFLLVVERQKGVERGSVGEHDPLTLEEVAAESVGHDPELRRPVCACHTGDTVRGNGVGTVRIIALAGETYVLPFERPCPFDEF